MRSLLSVRVALKPLVPYIIISTFVFIRRLASLNRVTFQYVLLLYNTTVVVDRAVLN